MLPDCPECEQGKHGNCTRMVLVGDDAEVPCGCAANNHGEPMAGS